MVITYYGATCFKVQSGETVLVFNPPSKQSEFKTPRFQANVVFISTNHKDYNGSENIGGKSESDRPFVVEGPGEYEMNGVHIKGEADSDNSIYTVELEGITLCHLGKFSSKDLNAEIKESLGKIDILFVPINGHTSLDPQKAVRLISQLEPRIVIPMDYDMGPPTRAGKGGKGQLKSFMEEFGNGSIKPEEKLSIKKKDIAEKEIRVVVLQSA